MEIASTLLGALVVTFAIAVVGTVAVAVVACTVILTMRLIGWVVDHTLALF